MFYTARNEAIKFFDDYSLMVSEAKNKATKVTGLKILTPEILHTWKNIKNSYINNKFKISTPTWNDKFKLPDGSYSVSDI